MGRKKVINTGMVESGFFSKDDVSLNIDWGRDYLESDIPASVLLFRIDRVKTKVDSLYGETRASEKIVLNPVELRVKMNIEDEDAEFIGDSLLQKHNAGQLIFTVYQKELDEKEVKITRGDYVGFKNSKNNFTYYEVNDADINNVSNSKTIGGLDAFYRKITCSIVDKDQFQG